MCRLFGLNAGTVPVHATFWLLDAPDSIEEQSRRNQDGSGIGFFAPDGTPVVDKQAEPAYSDEEFVREAKAASATTFVSHVRYASAGPRRVENTHPFQQAGRIMAHNGGFGELERLDARLGDHGALVVGDTDSERFFALITRETELHDGDVGAGIVAAARWIGENLPVSSLNLVLISPGELWALRYPGQHALHLLERRPGGHRGAGALHSETATLGVHVPLLAEHPSVVVASERLDDEPGWRMLDAGELVHVGPDLRVRSTMAVAAPPARLVPLPAEGVNDDS